MAVQDERFYQVTQAIDPAAIYSDQGPHREFMLAEAIRRSFTELWRGIGPTGKHTHMIVLKWEAEVWVKLPGKEGLDVERILWVPTDPIPDNTHLLMLTVRTVPVANSAEQAEYTDPVGL